MRRVSRAVLFPITKRRRHDHRGRLRLIDLALACGGAWLAALGGSFYYVVAGVGILITGVLLFQQRRSALCVYAAMLIGTLIWAVSEIRFDWWPSFSAPPARSRPLILPNPTCAHPPYGSTSMNFGS